MSQAKSRLVSAVAALAPRLQAWAGALAAGTGAAPLVEALTRAGFAVTPDVAGVAGAFAAAWQGAAGGPRLALLAEYDPPDAPAPEDAAGDCQHHLTGALMTGAAVALSAQGPALPGALRVLGVPALPGVRLRLLAAGLMEGCDAAFLAHPGQAWQAGPETLALQPLSLVFNGRSAHASAEPEQGVNALDACIGLFNSVAALRQHLPPGHQVHGIIVDGGRAPNRVPARAAALLYLRAPDALALAALLARVRACAEGAAAAAGAQVAVEPAAAPLEAFRVNATLAAAFARNLFAIGAGRLEPPGPPVGSSDAGNLSVALPCLGIVFPPNALPAAAKAMALTALDALVQSDLLARAAAELPGPPAVHTT